MFAKSCFDDKNARTTTCLQSQVLMIKMQEKDSMFAKSCVDDKLKEKDNIFAKSCFVEKMIKKHEM